MRQIVLAELCLVVDLESWLASGAMSFVSFTRQSAVNENDHEFGEFPGLFGAMPALIERKSHIDTFGGKRRK